MALTTADREEYIVRKMIETGGYEYTQVGTSRFLGKNTTPSDSVVESYLINARDSESQAAYNNVISKMDQIRNEVSP